MTPTTFTYDPVEQDITDNRGVVIAQMCQFDDDDEIARLGQLLATAPELLDAADALMDVLRELPRGPQHDAMVNLHYIIAKARIIISHGHHTCICYANDNEHANAMARELAQTVNAARK